MPGPPGKALPLVLHLLLPILLLFLLFALYLKVRNLREPVRDDVSGREQCWLLLRLLLCGYFLRQDLNNFLRLVH